MKEHAQAGVRLSGDHSWRAWLWSGVAAAEGSRCGDRKGKGAVGGFSRCGRAAWHFHASHGAARLHHTFRTTAVLAIHFSHVRHVMGHPGLHLVVTAHAVRRGRHKRAPARQQESGGDENSQNKSKATKHGRILDGSDEKASQILSNSGRGISAQGTFPRRKVAV